MSKKINKNLVRQRFLKGLDTYADHAVVQRQMVDELLQQFKPFSSLSYGRVLEIGCGAGLLTKQLLKSFVIDEYIINDLVPECEEIVTTLCNEYNTKNRFISGDIESIELPNNLDLIASNAAFQWLENPNYFLTKIEKSLKPDGYFIFTSFGPDNLKETATLTAQKLAYPTLEELTALVGKKLQVIYASEQSSQMNFPSPLAVLKHFKKTGVTGLSTPHWNKSMLQDFITKYQKKYPTVHGVSLTYHPIFIIAKNATTSSPR